jgi:hypothetical protein
MQNTFDMPKEYQNRTGAPCDAPDADREWIQDADWKHTPASLTATGRFFQD